MMKAAKLQGTISSKGSLVGNAKNGVKVLVDQETVEKIFEETLTDYAKTDHKHDEYAKQTTVDNLSKEIDDLKENGIGSSVEPMEDDIPKVYFAGTLPTSKNDGDLPVTIHYKSKTEEFDYYATLKVQGGSSANYPKKNFTLKMYEDEALENKVKREFKSWGKLNKWVLKAHWIDHSHVRNVGTAKIWGKIVQSRSDYDSLPTELKNAPNNGATDGFTVKVFANGVYQGLYEWIVPKDKLFGQDSDIATHSIMNSEWNNQATCAFATTSPVISGNWSEELQDTMSSNISTSFANLIKFVAGSTDEEFIANAENYFDVQSVIDFDIFARVFCIVDNLCRNQIFFTYDGIKWYEGVWDVDAILGLPPTTRGFFAYNTEFQTGYIAHKDYGVTNMLYQKVENLFMNKFKERYADLRSTVLSIENIIEVYERLTDVITTYEGLLKEDYARTTGDGKFTGIPYTSENNIQQIRNFIAQRLVYMDEVITGMIEPIPCTGVTLNTNILTFTDEENQTLTATVTPENTTDVITWESSHPSIATVANGVVTPSANGNCTITATCGSYSATCSVTVSLEESEEEKGLLYSLPSEVLFDGTQNSVVDTGVNLLDGSVDSFTIYADFTNGRDGENDGETLFMAGIDIAPYPVVATYTNASLAYSRVAIMGQNVEIPADWFHLKANNSPVRKQIVLKFTYNPSDNMLNLTGVCNGSTQTITGSKARRITEGTLVLGATRNSATTFFRFFSGTIHNFKVWNYELSESEIVDLFNS